MQPILFKSVGSLVLFLKAYHIENLNSQNVQSLIPMGKDRSFGNTISFDYVILGSLTE